VAALQIFTLRVERSAVENMVDARGDRDQRDPAVEPFHDVAARAHRVRRAMALPVAVVAVVMLHQVALARFLQQATVGMVVHEFGHAVAAWLSGTLAVPALFVTMTGERRHLYAFLLPMGGAVVAMWRGWKRDLSFWLVFGLLLLPIVAVGAFGLSEVDRPMWISWAGVGGEFVLGALLVIASNHTLAHTKKWASSRYVCLVVGVAALVPAYIRWTRIAAGTDPFPIGSLIYGDSDGDMNRLLAAGYTQAGIAHGYLTVGAVCLALIALDWIVGLLMLRAQRLT
jgi:hypothetical protein